jgi:hypothetical protein
VFNGAISLVGTGNSLITGSSIFESTVSIGAGATLSLSGLSTQFDGTVSNNGNLIFSSGVLLGVGLITINNAASMLCLNSSTTIANPIVTLGTGLNFFNSFRSNNHNSKHNF